MIKPLQSESDLSVGLLGSLNALRRMEGSADQIRFSQSLLGMYPEGSDVIIYAISPALTQQAQTQSHDDSRYEIIQMWLKLLELSDANDPNIDRACQMFLLSVCAGDVRFNKSFSSAVFVPDGLTSNFFSQTQSKPIVYNNFAQILVFSQTYGAQFPWVVEDIKRNEPNLFAVSMQRGSAALARLLVSAGPIDRTLGLFSTQSWMHHWVYAAQHATTIDRAEIVLDALLSCGVSVDQTDADGLTALEWATEPSRVEDFIQNNPRALLSKFSSTQTERIKEELYASLTPVIQLLMDRGADWTRLSGLAPQIKEVLDQHPAVRKYRLLGHVEPSAHRSCRPRKM